MIARRFAPAPNRTGKSLIRFLHTADWQIGKPFGGFPDEVRFGLREERINVVTRIAALARERNCDAVLVAGDVFDDAMPSERDMNRTLSAMAGFEGAWVLLPGNHDAALSASVWTRLRRRGLPQNILIADRPEPIVLKDGALAILPAPLSRRFEGADLTRWFDDAPTPPSAVRVGLAHGAVENRLPEKADAGNPIADGRARTARLDYLALGDWHGFVEIAPKTVYAGTPEPDRYPANEPGHVAIVEIEAPGAQPQIDKVAIARFRWLAASVRLDGDLAELSAFIERLPLPGETLLNLSLSGTLPLRERVQLDTRVEDWRSRLYDLRLNDGELYDEPDEEDLDLIDVGGFVRVAIDRLRAKAVDPGDPEREAAQLALRMAYAEHRRLGDPER